MGLTLREFIEKTLIKEIKSIQQTYGHHYLSFGLIAQGVELLGACLDNSRFHEKGKSSTRFRRAIKELFPIEYQPFNDKSSNYDLYTNLRCGLLHVVVPGSFIELIQESEKMNFGEHLEVKEIRGRKRLVLVSKDLFCHFENACNEIIRRIDSRTIDPNKITGTLIETSP